MKGLELTRTIAKVFLVGCAGLWLWQVGSIIITSNEVDKIERQVEITKAELNKMEMLEAEVKSKTGFWGGVSAFIEGFTTGATLGLLDDEGFWGPVRREERWEKSVRDRAVEYQTGIDNANSTLEQAMNRHRELSMANPKKLIA